MNTFVGVTRRLAPGCWHDRARSRRTPRLAALSLALAVVSFSLPSCRDSVRTDATEEVHHDDYRLDDGSVVFLSRVGGRARYREGDQVLFLARRSANVFASRRGDTITVLDGGNRIRIEARTGEARLGERTELYREEEVVFHNGEVRLVGTLLVPPDPGAHPAVILAEGAGRTTRHGFGRILADHFARHGIAALVYDKRGAGDSTGRYGAFIRDYGALAADLLAGVRLLKSRPDIHPGRIAVGGTSEGGWVVALAAARSSDIAYVMGISAPARPGPNGVWEMQNKLRDARVPDDAIFAMTLASTQVVSVVRRLGLLPECCRHASFPESEWNKVRQPVLLLYGELDKQVPPALSALTLSEALRRGGNQEYLVRAFPRANHAVMVAETGFESEMRSAAAVRFAPGYLDTMVEWLQARLAGEPSPAEGTWTPRVTEQIADLDNPPWHASPPIQLGLWAAFLAIFSATCTSPLLRRRIRRSPDASQLDPLVGRARRLAVVVSAAYLMLAGGLLAALAQFGTDEPLRPLWTGLRVLAFSSSLLAMALAATTTLAWRRRWPSGARLRHTVVTAASVGFLPFLSYWRLLA
jgi:dienelactone hydrolase